MSLFSEMSDYQCKSCNSGTCGSGSYNAGSGSSSSQSSYMQNTQMPVFDPTGGKQNDGGFGVAVQGSYGDKEPEKPSAMPSYLLNGLTNNGNDSYIGANLENAEEKDKKNKLNFGLSIEDNLEEKEQQKTIFPETEEKSEEVEEEETEDNSNKLEDLFTKGTLVNSRPTFGIGKAQKAPAGSSML